jgi:uncharacterized tellurite resistance protein B-like protein
MVTLNKSKNYLSGMVALYYLLIHADGEVNEKEVKSGEIMRQHEGINEMEFEDLLELYKRQDKEILYEECVNTLRGCSYSDQVKIVAWMSRIANSDGFMDPREWKLIYQVYYRELGLDLQDILQVQKSLPACFG